MAIQLTVGGRPPVMPPPSAAPAYTNAVQNWQQDYGIGWQPPAPGQHPTQSPVLDPAQDPYTVTTPVVQGQTGPIGPNMSTDWTGMIGGSFEVAQAEAFMAEQMA